MLFKSIDFERQELVESGWGQKNHRYLIKILLKNIDFELRAGTAVTAAAITAAPAARTVGPPRHSPTGRSFRTRRRANHLHRSCIACARMGCLSLRIGSCRRMDSCVSGPAQCCMSSASRWRQQMGLSSAEVLYRLSTTQLELYVTTRTWYVQACSVLCTDHLGST